MQMRHGVKLIVTSVAALVATVTLPATAQTAPGTGAGQTATAPDAAKLKVARALTAVLGSDEMIRLQIDKMFDQSIPAMFAADPDIAEVEAEYPGLIPAVVDAMRPIVYASIEKRIPELRDRMAVFYAEEMTLDELEATLVFFRSPTGQKFVRLLNAGADYSSMLETFTKDPNAQLSGNDIQKVALSGLAEVQRQMTPAERDEILRFEASPAGRKVARLGPRVQAMTAEWTNESDPETDAAIEAAVMKAATDFIAKAEQ